MVNKNTPVEYDLKPKGNSFRNLNELFTSLCVVSRMDVSLSLDLDDRNGLRETVKEMTKGLNLRDGEMYIREFDRLLRQS